MVVFRSLLVALKAVMVNLLSIGAAYGVSGRLPVGVGRRPLRHRRGRCPIESFVPMMMFAILFGLSMDYEVFLLSRIREEYDRTGDNAAAVADGLARTARVITAAAPIMVDRLLAFVLDDQVVVKMFGLGLATAVLARRHHRPDGAGPLRPWSCWASATGGCPAGWTGCCPRSTSRAGPPTPSLQPTSAGAEPTGTAPHRCRTGSSPPSRSADHPVRGLLSPRPHRPGSRADVVGPVRQVGRRHQPLVQAVGVGDGHQRVGVALPQVERTGDGGQVDAPGPLRPRPVLVDLATGVRQRFGHRVGQPVGVGHPGGGAARPAGPTGPASRPQPRRVPGHGAEVANVERASGGA